jgi:hypothetical protein
MWPERSLEIIAIIKKLKDTHLEMPFLAFGFITTKLAMAGRISGRRRRATLRPRRELGRCLVDGMPTK